MPRSPTANQLPYLNALIIAAYGSAKIVTAQIVAARGNYEQAFIKYAPFSELRVDVDKEWKKLETNDVRLLVRGAAAFPKELAKASDAPYALYYKGNLAALNARRCAVVGTRRMTDYGRRATRDIAGALSRAGICIVSGMAVGIDAAAHEAALATPGPTIAVLGSGLDEKTIYPKQNLQLARRILENGGLLLSEYSCGMPAQQYTFRDRNRIVAALAEAVLVIEADIKSGSLITAKLALEMGIDVGAVPGSIYATVARGTHLLIRNGAAPITAPDDALELFGLTPALAVQHDLAQLDSSATAVLGALESASLSLDAIARAVGQSIPAVAATLALMEADRIIECRGGTYSRRGR